MITLKFKYDSDVVAILNALHVAADQYRKDAQTTLDGAPMPIADGYVSLARQFRDQAVTATRLAGEVEDQQECRP